MFGAWENVIAQGAFQTFFLFAIFYNAMCGVVYRFHM
jgi:hypothetical protein